MKIGSLFSGYGGLEIGLQAVLGGEVAWHCEIDPAASAILAHHWPDVPNLGDITAVDWKTVEPVDVLCGGFPCQDVSAAGKRAGITEGTRSGLWRHFATAIDVLRPQLVVIENVRGLLSAKASHPGHSDLEPCPGCLGGGQGEPALRALGAVLGDLADLGFDARWQGVTATEVGAPHQRFRTFVIAWPADADLQGLEGGEPARGRLLPAGRAAADAERLGRDRRPRLIGASGWAEPSDGSGTAAYPQGDGRDEGGPEPARLIGGSDAAERGAETAADADLLLGTQEHEGANRIDEERSPVGRGPVQLAGAGGGVEPDRGGAPLKSATGQSTPPGVEGDRGEADPDAAQLGRGPEGWDDGVRAAGLVARYGAWGDYEPAVRRWEGLTRPAPPPTEPGRRGQPRLSPAFVEWMMGLPDGWVTAVPGITRNQQLKALGNGVVPQQAEHAIRLLLDMEMPLVTEVAAS